MSHLGVVLLLSLLPLRLDLVPAGWDGVLARGNGRAQVVVLQELTDDLRTRLQISEQVQVTLVEHNHLVSSTITWCCQWKRSQQYLLLRRFSEDLDYRCGDAARILERVHDAAFQLHNVTGFHINRLLTLDRQR